MAPTRCGSLAAPFPTRLNLTGNGGRTQISILAGGLLDVDDVERIEIKGQGEFQDNVIINDLSGTDVKQVAIIVERGPGGLSDDVSFWWLGPATISSGASSTGAIVSITGLPANVTIAGGDKFSFINIHGGDGDDKIDASKIATGSRGGLEWRGRQ